MVKVTLPALPKTEYAIHIQPGLLTQTDWLLPDAHQLVIITDHTVKKLYGNVLAENLKAKGYPVLLLSFPAGEHSKQAKIKQKLEEQMLSQHYGRDSLILALGGGVVGDLAGFIAATYMRGIPYLQIPTTLLAMIDSSVGGKTGINMPQGKNLIGAFWHPKAVITDTTVLQTLPKQHIIAGLVEAIKIFLTSDHKSFIRTQQELAKILSLEPEALVALLESAVSLKAQIVGQDEQEKGLRMVLNFGHTVGHALEKLTDYKLLHGHAVAYGILVEAKISQLMGILSDQEFHSIQSLFKILGFEGVALKKYSVTKLIQLTLSDKKAQNQTVRYVLLKTLGSVYEAEDQYAHEVPEFIIHSAFLNVIEGS